MKSLKYYSDKFQFSLKRHFVEVLESSNSDNSIAWGFALGTFVAILPTPGLSTFIGIALIAIFKNLNKLSVFIALAIWNPFTAIPLYWLSMKVGILLYSSEPTVHFKFEFVNQLYDYSRRFVVGNLFVSIPVAFGCYYLALFLVRKTRKFREVRRQKKTSN